MVESHTNLMSGPQSTFKNRVSLST